MSVTLNWRKNEYEFEWQTRGQLVEKVTRNSTIDAPIWGADTESVLLPDGRYEVQCIQLAGGLFGQHLEWLPSRQSAFALFCRLAIRAWTAEEEPEQAVLYFHNLEYDWLQLIKDDEKMLAMAKVGVSPNTETFLCNIGSWKVYLDKGCIFTGNAPFIKLKFQLHEASKKKGRSGSTFRLYIYDTFSYFPSSLAKLGKDLGLEEQKEERQADIGLRDYRIEADSIDKADFVHYAKRDANVTRLAGEKIRELHQLHGFQKLKPSAPSYAISVLYKELPEGVQIKNGSDDARHIQMALDAYRGGRTGGIFHGFVKNLWVLDFHSSYPASMTSLPSFSPSMAYIDLENLELDYVMDILAETGNAFLRISGTETDNKYPAFLQVIRNKLTPVYGDFENLTVTGYEFYAAVKSGSLKNVVIHEAVVLLDMDEDVYLPFKEFAEQGYREKEQSLKGTLLYIAAKLKLNSAYGKLIESRAQKLLGLTDNAAMFPYIEGMEKDFAEYYYTSYLQCLEDGRDEDEWYFETTAQVLEEFEQDETEWKYQELTEFHFGGYVYGAYVVPAAASLITGCSRARLYCAMKATGALYWDTDSIFVEGATEESIAAALERTADWLPDNAIPIRIGDALGEMDIEFRGGSGWLAGTKRYYLEADGQKPKKATHGIPALDSSLTKEVIRALATGEDFLYTSKARPMKAKEAATADDIGRFRSRQYLPKFRLDSRLNWQQTDDGWQGTIIDYRQQLQTDKERQQELDDRRKELLPNLNILRH